MIAWSICALPGFLWYAAPLRDSQQHAGCGIKIYIDKRFFVVQSYTNTLKKIVDKCFVYLTKLNIFQHLPTLGCIVTILKSHLLIVDDDVSFSDEICSFLSRHEFKVTAVRSLTEMRSAWALGDIDLIILDQFLDGENTLSSFIELRINFDRPIVILTGNTDPTDLVLGLEMGAYDFINKTQPAREILARIRAALRRGNPISIAPKVNTWTIDRDARKVTSPARGQIHFTSLEYEILLYMAERRGQSITRQTLMNDVFKKEHISKYDRTVDTYISRLRAKIRLGDGDADNFFKSDRTAGYRFTGNFLIT